MRFLRRRKLPWDTRGTTTVEFALIAVCFLSFAYGSLELMGVIQAWSGLQWACDTTARHAMANPSMTASQVQAYAQNQGVVAGYATSRGAVYTATTSTSTTHNPVTLVLVTGTYTYNFHVAPSGFQVDCHFSVGDSAHDLMSKKFPVLS